MRRTRNPGPGRRSGIVCLVAVVTLAALGSSLAGAAPAATPDSVVLEYLNARAPWDSLFASGPRDSMILHRLELDWPIRSWNGRTGQGVMVASSPGGRYFVLTGVRFGEDGPGGDCHHCLVDSLGHRLWTRDGRMVARPQVSDSGDVVLFETDDRESCARSMIVRWLGSNGLATGEHAFGPLAIRTYQRSCSNEVQFLDGAARRVYFTINEQPEPGDPPSRSQLGEIDNVRLVAMNPDGSIEWTYQLGGMAANAIDLALGGRRIVVDDLGTASAEFDNVLIVLTSEGHLAHRIVLEKNRSTYHAVVERDDRYVLFADAAVRRMDTETGEISTKNSEWLEGQALEWKSDTRAVLARRRLRQLENLRREVIAQEETDWPEYYRRRALRWGR